jgi:alkaline phosphatase D
LSRFLLLCYLVSVTHAADFSFPNTTLMRVAFGSCHKNKYANTEHSIWKTIQEESDPQLWLWTGDAVYPPDRGIASLDLLRQEYSQMKENATIGYSSFKPPLGTFGTWDDHDYGANDAGRKMPDKSERKFAYPVM